MAPTTGSHFITIRVDDGKARPTHFFVQKDVLCRTSPFMQARCKPEWSQNDNNTIILPETTPQAFQIYIDWLYHGSVCPSKYATLEESSKAYFVLGTAYVLGEILQDIPFGIAIIDTLHQRCLLEDFEPSVAWIVDIITVIYNGTTNQSGARRFVTDMVVVKNVSAELWDYSDDLHKDFFRDLARSYHVKGGTEAAGLRWTSPGCHYHANDLENTCPCLIANEANHGTKSQSAKRKTPTRDESGGVKFLRLNRVEQWSDNAGILWV
ncbi:hypothetical protein CKM354_000503400 [Cercospora kikuchii]|uniref:BTB domain-containing protein n=1 Tax=Cercospora kikuchii TaxID=84275 RepID=A0A9P3CFB2_9PEZI|nr:uncharacterized protein CKM354_000503400 [Cercospora kikuchii]GIZ41738.1 hypothetical protein CKM354_000503400 [Cercospora kikuchii]